MIKVSNDVEKLGRETNGLASIILGLLGLAARIGLGGSGSASKSFLSGQVRLKISWLAILPTQTGRSGPDLQSATFRGKKGDKLCKGRDLMEK